MAAKKSAAKKAAKKTVAKKAANPPNRALTATGSIDLLGGDGSKSFAAGAGAALAAAMSRKKNRVVNFTTQAELRIEFLTVRSIYLQWCLGNWGIPKGQTVEIIAKDKLGKTSLLYWLFGGFLMQGSPCLVVVGENKPMDRPWAVRCLSADPKMANRMLEEIGMLTSGQLDEMHEYLKRWILICRDPESAHYVPLHVPLVIAVDPVGKLATRQEAAGGGYVYDDLVKADEADLADKGHNWDRAKWMHDFMRRNDALQAQNNVNTFFVSHQNDEAAGGKMRPSFIPQWSVDLSHRTKPGGQASNQSSCLQLVLADQGVIYSGGVKVARRIALKPYKNSYGTDERMCSFALKQSDHEDRPGYIDPGIRWDYTTLEWMAEHGLLGVKKTGQNSKDLRYSSVELGFTQLTLMEAARVIDTLPQEKIDELGKRLLIPGYIDIYQHIMDQVAELPESAFHEPAVEETEVPDAD